MMNKDEILDKLKELKGNKIVVVIAVLVIAFFLVVAGSSLLQSCSNNSSSSSTEDTKDNSEAQDNANKAAPKQGQDGDSTKTNVPNATPETSAPGMVIPGDQQYKIQPNSKGSGSKYITGPPKNPIPVKNADFPGGFPLAPGSLVSSTKKVDRKSTVKFWLADPQGAAKFYENALTDSQLYVDAQTISGDRLMSYFKFSGDGYGAEGGTLTIRGSSATLVWYAPEDVVVQTPPTTKKKDADKSSPKSTATAETPK